MTLEQETFDPEALSTREPECGQKISKDGRIVVGRKAWIARVVTLSGLIFIMLFNLSIGLALSDPLVVYSTLMPFHTLMVFSVGWLLFKSRANGHHSNELVSVIIPAYNQESLIEEVVDAVYKSTYKHIEVIVIDDGSKDSTGEVLDYLALKYYGLNVIHKENGGKRTAVAAGFHVSKGKYFVLIDSDSIIDINAIEEMVKAFNANPRVGGIVGNGKVWNSDKNLLTKCQTAWYDYAFNIHKSCESYFGTVLCCSGCLAAYRREAIAEYIPYWADSKIQYSDDRALTTYTLAAPWAKKELAPLPRKLMESMAKYDDSEDRGLTAQALISWETIYVPKALVYTDVPETFHKYIRQQTRWKKGYVRSNFFVSAFFWRKNPIIALIFYLEFMMAFTSPLVIFTIYIYGPLVLHELLLPLNFIAGQILVGLASGLDYKAREKSAKYWMYNPLMNIIISMFLTWLIFPALLTYRKNKWLTR